MKLFYIFLYDIFSYCFSLAPSVEKSNVFSALFSFTILSNVKIVIEVNLIEFVLYKFLSLYKKAKIFLKSALFSFATWLST